jgi:hypothetical protein
VDLKNRCTPAQHFVVRVAEAFTEQVALGEFWTITRNGLYEPPHPEQEGTATHVLKNV